MSIFLLFAAIVLWAVAGLPGVIQIPVLAGKVDFGWAGMVAFGFWLVAGGAPQLLAFVQRPRA